VTAREAITHLLSSINVKIITGSAIGYCAKKRGKKPQNLLPFLYSFLAATEETCRLNSSRFSNGI